MKAIWDWLITPPLSSGVFTPLSAVYLVVFLVGFVVSAYKLRGEGCPAVEADATGNRILPCERIALWLFGAGLVFFAARALQIDPLLLAAPIWMVAAILALFVTVWRCVDVRRLK